MSGNGSLRGSPHSTLTPGKSKEKMNSRNGEAESATQASHVSSIPSPAPNSSDAAVSVTTAALLATPIAMRRSVSTPATIETSTLRIQRPFSTPRVAPRRLVSPSSLTHQSRESSRPRSSSVTSQLSSEGKSLSSGYVVRRQRSSSMSRSRVSGEETPLGKGYIFRRQTSLPTRTSSVKDRSFHPLVVDGEASVGSLSEESLGFGEKSFPPPPLFRPVGLQALSPSTIRSDSRSSHRVSFVRDEPPLDRIDTAESSEDELIVAVDTELGSPRRRMAKLTEADTEHSASTPDDKNNLGFRRNSVHYIVYLSTFAAFGVFIRVFVGRFFGLDCELEGEINDWFSTFARNICVTATGLTEQTGGALFIDLPANMLGSFLMGLLTVQAHSNGRSLSPLPWLKADHPLQNHDAFNVAIQTGMCGCLTTFASWNAQLVVMMDGSQTELGAQVLPALAGYIIGMMTALASFVFGSHVSIWIDNYKRKSDSRTASEEYETHDAGYPAITPTNENPPPRTIMVYPKFKFNRDSPFWKNVIWTCSCTRLPFFILAGLLSIFLVADFVWGIAFYRGLWLQALFAPPGALLRWFLASRWNDNMRPVGRFSWVPWGTLVANLVGCLVSVVMLDVEFWYLRKSGELSEWALSIIMAVRVGFAGSLSTVSTFVKELVDIQNHYPNQGKAYQYGLLTIGTAMVMSLVVYIPIVRSTD